MTARLFSNNAGTITAAVVLLMADTLSVFARLVAKRRVKRPLRNDDLWMFTALGTFYVWAVITLYLITNADSYLQPKTITTLIWTIWTIYMFTITAVKFSILSFYRTIFDCLRWFEISTYVLSVLCMLWLISGTVISGMLTFSPKCQRYRGPRVAVPRHDALCLHFAGFLVVHGFLNAVIDIMMLVLPILVIPRMNLSRRQKLQASAVFLVGGLIVVVSVLRILYVIFIMDASKKGTSVEKSVLMSVIELGTAIICGNLPLYRSLLSKETVLRHRIENWYSVARSFIPVICRYPGSLWSPWLIDRPEQEDSQT